MGWEEVSQAADVVTHRLPVPDGWMYRVTDGGAVAAPFVPSAGDTPTGASPEDMPRLDD